MPLLSLIMPVYNNADCLEQSVSAVLGQTCADFELLLVDDGSTDDSGAVCDRLAAKDARIRVIHQPNSGAGAARNAGIDAATGQFLFFPDADDFYEPDMLAVMLEAEQRTGADVVVCGYHSFDESGELPPLLPDDRLYPDRDTTRAFFTSCFPQGLAGYPWNKLYKKQLIDEHNLRFPDMRRFQDGMFNLDYFEHAASCCTVARPLYHYRVNTLGGVFRKYPPDIFDLLCRITDAYYAKLDAWALRGDDAERTVVPFFLNGVVGCIDNTYSPAWGFDHARRRAYFAQLAAHPTVRYCAARPHRLGRYADSVIALLVKRRFGMLLLLTRTKLILKRDFNGLFHRLKRHGNGRRDNA